MTSDSETEFIPDEVETQRHSDGVRVKLVFRRDDGGSREVVVRRSWLPQLLNTVRAEIDPNSAVRIDQNSLRPGQDFSAQGWECHRLPGGAARLVFYIDLPDQNRVVTLPLTLEEAEVLRLIERLTK